MATTDTKHLKILIPMIFYSLLVVFLIIYLQSIDLSKLENINLSWTYFLVATLLALIFRYWGSLIWLTILNGLGAVNLRYHFIELIYVYAKSWLGRYIPGTAPWILGKIYFASQHGISKNKLAVSSLLEGGLQVMVIMIVAITLLLFDPRMDVIDPFYKYGMGLIAVCGAIALTPSVFNKVISLIYRLIKKKSLDIEHYINKRIIIIGSLMYTAGAIISGLSFFFISKAIYPELSFSNIPYMIGSFSLAGAMSMLAFFAPSGIGVREGILLVLLSIIMPTEIALAITVFSRLWSVCVDFIFFLLALMTKKTRLQLERS